MAGSLNRSRGFRLIPAMCGALLFLLGAGSAAQAQCERTEPQIRIVTTNAPVRYRNDQSRAQINAIASGTNATVGAHALAIGITSAEFRLGIDMEYRIGRIGSEFCVIPIAITIEVGYPIMEVSIDNRYRPGTCPYRVILAHENRHVQINHSMLQTHLGNFRAFVNNAVRSRFPLRTATSEMAVRLAFDHVQAGARRAQERMVRERNQQHARLDSAESYRRANAQCSDW